MKPPRYRIVCTDDTTDTPTYEVRRNAQGTADDWDPGVCMGVFHSQQQADNFAQQLRTLTLTCCPRCGAGLSCNSYEQYCAYADCLWNNDQ